MRRDCPWQSRGTCGPFPRGEDEDVEADPGFLPEPAGQTVGHAAGARTGGGEGTVGFISDVWNVVRL